MKITRLQMENFKRITAAEITPDGNLVVLSGANAQGKTSILDGIWAALGGRAASTAIDQPLRHGAEEGFVRLELGDLIVTRKWKAEKTTLTVESADGAKYSSPQKMLDDLVGKLSFDPLAFATFPSKVQRDTLLALVDLPFDPAALDVERREAFEERTRVNRLVKELDGQLAGFMPLPEGLPDEEVSVAAVMRERMEAEDAHKRDREVRYAADRARARRIELELELERAKELEAAHLAEVAALPELPDLAALQERIESVDEINALVREREQRAAVQTRRDRYAEQAERLTAFIVELDRRKADGLASANFPVPGLGFDDEGVTFNGVPFSQASSAERLRVSTAMGMALNPRLRVMHIRDASLLDSSNMATLASMAEEQDFQLWVERVDESGGMGIVIEDGTARPAA